MVISHFGYCHFLSTANTANPPPLFLFLKTIILENCVTTYKEKLPQLFYKYFYLPL